MKFCSNQRSARVGMLSTPTFPVDRSQPQWPPSKNAPSPSAAKPSCAHSLTTAPPRTCPPHLLRPTHQRHGRPRPSRRRHPRIHARGMTRTRHSAPTSILPDDDFLRRRRRVRRRVDLQRHGLVGPQTIATSAVYAVSCPMGFGLRRARRRRRDTSRP